jgi:hypothetical protein
MTQGMSQSMLSRGDGPVAWAPTPAPTMPDHLGIDQVERVSGQRSRGEDDVARSHELAQPLRPMHEEDLAAIVAIVAGRCPAQRLHRQVTSPGRVRQVLTDVGSNRLDHRPHRLRCGAHHAA